MTLDINKEKMTIIEVPFENRSVFKSVLYDLAPIWWRGWQPTVSDVERLRNEVVSLVSLNGTVYEDKDKLKQLFDKILIKV